MRRPWIKIETCTPDKPEICSLATHLKLDEDTVVGKLVRLWSWAELNRVQPNDIGVTKEFIDKVVGRKGFAAALAQTGWLVETGEKLSFRNFTRHNSPVAQNKALTAKRVARHRLRKAQVEGKTTHETLATEDHIEPRVKAPRNGGNIRKKKPIIKEEVTKEPLPQEPLEEAVAPKPAAFTNYDENMITSDMALEINVEEVFAEPLPATETVLPAVEEPVAIAVVDPTPAPLPEITPEEALAALQVEEPSPKKRRSKAAQEVEDQPMLF